MTTTAALIFRTVADVVPGTTVLDPIAPALFTVESAYSTHDGRTTLTGHDATGTYHRLRPDTAATLPTVLEGTRSAEVAVPDTYAPGTTATVQIVPARELTPGAALLLDLAAVTTVTDARTSGPNTWLTLNRPTTPEQRAPFASDEPVVRILTA